MLNELVKGVQLYEAPDWPQSSSPRNALSKIQKGSLLHIHPFMASSWDYFHLLNPQTWFSSIINNTVSIFCKLPSPHFFYPCLTQFSRLQPRFWFFVRYLLCFLRTTVLALLPTGQCAALWLLFEQVMRWVSSNSLDF